MKQSKKLLSAMLAAALVFTMAPPGFVSNAVSAPGNIELSRQAATEGMVLLENNRSALPIPAGSTVALFGRGQIDFQKGGGGSGDVTVEYVRNLLQGMQEKQKEGKVRVYQPLADAYAGFIASGEDGEMALSDELLTGAAAAADTAVVTISRYSQEGIDRTAEKGDYYLSDAETEMLAKVAAAGFDKIAVVLNVGGIVDTSWFADSGADALLLAWQPGMEGGLAAADILVGDVNPSGKLSDTFAKDFWDYPTSQSFHENHDYVNYTEDVFVGYRYFETFDPDYQKVNYEFGYGLSYTTFDITDVSAVPNGDQIEVSATVTNTGEQAGKEVVQAYFSAPQMGEGGAKLSKPAKELAAFDKTDLLAPGESQTLTMTYDIDDMSSYDDTGVTGHKSAYVLEAGDYDIYVGSSIRNAGESGVRASWYLDSLQVAEQLSEKVKPTNLTERLLADGSREALDTGLAVKAEGSTKLEAEYYTNKSPSLRGVESYPDGDWLSVTSVYYMYSEPADALFLSYKLKVQQAGVYRLQLRAGNAGGALYDFADITVDGQAQPQARLYAPNTGGDNQLIDLDSVYISLPEGDCELTLTASSNRLPTIDFFTLEKTDYETPPENAIGQKIEGNGVNKIEAEDYFAAHENFFLNRMPTGLVYLGNKNTSGLYLTYKMDVLEAGVYRLIWRSALGQDSYRDMMRIEVNGIEQPVSLTAASTGGWESFKDLSPVYLRLEAGENTIRFSDKLGKLPNFDYYTLERIGDEMPEGHLVTNKGSSVVEAEDYLDAHENFVIQTPTVNGVQITTIGNQNLPGAWITYELYALEAGDYQISFCMANGVQPYSDFMQLYVNDVNQDVHLDMPQTGDGQGASEWFNFIDMPKVNVTLPKGRSVLKIVPNVVSFPNMDYMTVSPKPLVDPIKIEAEDWSAGHENLLLEHPVINGVQHTTLAKRDTDQLWVEYTFDSPMEGDWFFILNAASAYDPIKNFMKIYVGDELQEAQLDMPTTGNRDAGEWWNFIDLPAVRIRLPKGTCKLKFITNQSAFPNLDYFVLEKAADDILTPPETEKPDPVEPETPDPYILEDVANGVITLDTFIAQLSDDDLAWLANGHGAGIPGGTGTIGNMGAYGIPGANTCDGPAGIRLTESCTAWPCATLLACTFNTDLIEAVGKAAGTEAAINGGDIWLAPAMNIHRSPLCGRNFEYYSEDPLLSGKTGAALTRGVQSTGVFVTLKHFAANNKETNRKEGDSRMSERALREIYLKGFEIAVTEAAPGCVMSSYNRINGQFASACRELLTDILRDEWGFDGIVMTDWVISTKLPEEIKAGNNVKMPNAFDDSFVAVKDALASGELTREEMEENAKVILKLVMRTLAFEKVTQGVQTQEISGAGTTRIEAESFVWKSDRINVESCADAPGEVNIGTLYPGEWATYDVTVRQAGTYRMVFRIATTSSTGGAFDIFMDKELAGSYSNNGTFTGAWQNWATAEPFTVTLPAGRHTMKVACTRAGSNLNWFELTPIDVENPVGEGIQADGLHIDEEKGIISGAAFGDTVSSVLNRLSAEDERAELRIVGQDGSDVSADTAARTGMKVQLTYAGIVLREFDLSVTGDLGLSDQPGVQTLLAIKAHILGRSPLSDLQAVSADVYADGRINIFDLVQLKLMILRGFSFS